MRGANGHMKDIGESDGCGGDYFSRGPLRVGEVRFANFFGDRDDNSPVPNGCTNAQSQSDA